jgi:peptidoglycan-associated lipoprotein
MTRTRSLFVLWLAVSTALMLGGCGGKRPPAVATGGSSQPTTSRTPALPPSQPVEEGPDVQTVDSAAVDESMLSDPSGEGGPLADIHFDYDSAELTDQARATLEKHAAWLREHPDLRAVAEGHCDERGTVEYNLALGELRARAARDYLVSLGVPAGRLGTVSYGKERPLDPAAGEAAWSRNRRAHFAVSR